MTHLRRLGGAAAVAGSVLGGLALGLPASAAPGDDRSRTLFRFDDQVTESSGLVDLGSRVLTVNDSGDEAVVYVVDPRTGRTVGRTTYADEAHDVEALALGPDGDVWVGDIGDNGGSRTGVSVHRVPPPRDGDRRVPATTYDLVYDEGARDAEALLVSPQGRLYVVSKGLFGGEVWQAPARLSEERPNVLTSVGDAEGMITDGAWFPDGSHVVLRDYGVAYVYDVTRQPWRYVGRVDLPDLEQGEGIAVRRDRDLLISSEGNRQPVVAVSLPDRLAEAVARRSPEDEGVVHEDPPATGFGTLVDGGRDLRRVGGVVVAMIVLAVLVHRLVRAPRV